MLGQDVVPGRRECRPCPPVFSLQVGRVLRLDGRRLGLLGSTMLQVSCSCGHAGRVPVAELVARHGDEVRVRDAVAAMRCRDCGKQRIREVRWLGCTSGHASASIESAAAPWSEGL